MTWYAAHIVMYVELKHGQEQDDYPVWENIVLLSAKTSDEAFDKAAEIGAFDESDDDSSFKWNGKPACWKFGGVRKLTLCDDAEKRPKNQTELTWIEMRVPSEKALRDFIAGKPTKVTLSDRFPAKSPAATNGRARK